MKKIFIVLIITLILLPTVLVLAADDLSYTVLAPLPCIGSDQDCQQLAQKTELKDYVPGMFKLLIGLSAVWAVLMIVLGGIQYITTDAVFKKEEGRKRIENAIYGLLLVIGAWLILNTINPNLLEFNLNIEKIETKAPAGTEGTLTASSIQPAMENALIDLASKCTGCSIRQTSTTGGQHSPGSLHYQGLAVDIAPNTQLTQYITGSSQNPAPCQRFSKNLGGKTTTFLWEPKGAMCGTVASNGDHWHMSVTP